MNKNFFKKVRSLDTVLVCLAIFFLCLYSFNMSLLDAAFSKYFKYVILAISDLLLVIGCARTIYESRNKNIYLLIGLIIFGAIFLIGNGDLVNGNYFYPFLMINILFDIYILSFRKDWWNFAIYTIVFFAMEHIIATFATMLFPEFYRNNIVALFPEQSGLLLYQYDRHQLAGITQHYSTNALYLVTGLMASGYLLFFAEKKKKSTIIACVALFILNAVALLLTGKRAQVAFFIISAAVVLLVKNRKNIIRFLARGAIILVCSIGIIVSISAFIPSITNSFSRIVNSLGNSDAMDSRNLLYDFAWEQFEGNELFGIGWNNYQYQYEKYAPQKEMAHMHVHCIYIQLLCECGIIGALIVYGLLISLLVLPVRDIFKVGNKNEKNLKYVYLFLWFHIYILLEGILGNSLYDMQIFIPYCVVLAIFMSVHFDLKKGLPRNAKEEC